MEQLLSRLTELYDIFLTRIDEFGIDLERLGNLLVYDARQPMLFNTGLFLMLFTLFVIFYRMLRPWRVPRMLFVILFSLYFYYKTSGESYMILLGVAVSDYILGLCMERARIMTRGRTLVMKSIVALNVCVNVGLLAYFKYFGLLIHTFNEFFTSHIDPINVILPAGISFFTFRSISYIVDIYRGHTDACHNPLDYLFFLTFFPPLLAGPVVRAKDMLPQIKSNPVPSRDMTSEGIYLIMLGIIKKMVIADFISGNFVDRVFD
ncbi:MAG: MBOAT family protein, partial [Duncaniella sp.]|nr:MBOAT family protein [Duncaniella sp.]